MRSTWDFPMIFRTYGKRMSQQTRNPLVPRTAILLSENAANCLRPTSEAWRSEPGSRTLVLTAGTSQQWQCPDPPSISGSSVPTVGLGHVGVLLARSWDLGSAWGPRMIGLLEVPLPEVRLAAHLTVVSAPDRCKVKSGLHTLATIEDPSMHS
jgi:hypothetical protein